MTDIKIDVIGILSPSTYLQVLLPLSFHTVDVQYIVDDYSNFRNADILIIERDLHTSAFDVYKIEQIFIAYKNAKKILAIDDDLYTNDYRYSPSSLVISLSTKWISRKVDLIITTTEQIAKEARKFNNNVVIIPNSIYDEFFNIKHQCTEKIEIGYIGTPSHDKDINLMLEDLLDIKSKYDINITFLGGFIDNNQHYNNVNHVPYDWNKVYPEFMNYILSNYRFNIGLAPIKLTRKSPVGKSNLKYLDYTMLGAAGIYTDCNPYECVINRVTGLKINNERFVWKSSIIELIENDDLRSSIHNNAMKDITENYRMSNISKLLMNELIRLL